jgi:hypothetical protein
VPVPGSEPDRLSAVQVGDGSRVTGWRLLPAQAAMWSFEGDWPDCSGDWSGCTPAYPSQTRRPARARLRQGENQARPRSLGRSLFPETVPCQPSWSVAGLPLDTISLTRLLGQMPRSGASSLTQRFESRARRRRLDQMRSKAKLHSESCSGLGPEAPAPLSLPSLLSSRLTGVSLIYIRVRY